MKYIFNTVLCRKTRLAFVPTVLFVLFVTASLPCSSAALAGNQGGDVVSLSSVSALDDAAMSNNRGGTTTTTVTVSSNQTMESTSTGNSMVVFGNMANGPITVGSNFGGTGFGSYVMNTGNNSVINSGVSLSVLMMQ